MENIKFNVGKMTILFFVIGLITSCAKNTYDNLTVQQLMETQNVNFDIQEDLRLLVSKSRDTVNAWTFAEMENGRIVSRKLDRETGEYTCKSIPKKKVPLPAEDKILDLLDENGEFLLEDED